MQLIKMITPWGCMEAAAAMSLGTTIRKIRTIVGHDGSEVAFPYLRDPDCRRGLHTQEVVAAALRFGVAAVQIEAWPIATTNGYNRFDIKVMDRSNVRRLTAAMYQRPGILVGRTSRRAHAVAWDGHQAYDPRGKVVGLDDLELSIQTFYPFFKIKSF